ncbi:MAG: hypothetical protein V3S12_01260 [Acidiferrobacterales bacterium]
MSNEPKSLMTQYAEGCLISRELQDMMVDYAAQARFDSEMVDDFELSTGCRWGKYQQNRSRKS